MNLSANGVAVWRRCLYHAHVARPHQRELQGARYRGGGHREGVHIGLHLSQFLLCGNAEFLFLVDNQQTEVVELHRLPYQLVRTDDDVCLARFQVGENLFRLLRRPRPRQVVHPHGHILQTARESLVMLVGKHRGGHHDRHLFGITGGLEGGSYRHLRLSEAHVAAHEAVHGAVALHVGLHVVGGFQLVGRVLIEEARLQFVLHIGVGTVSEPLFVPPRGVELYQVAGDVLDFLLRLLLEPLPRPRANCAQARRCLAVAPLVF